MSQHPDSTSTDKSAHSSFQVILGSDGEIEEVISGGRRKKRKSYHLLQVQRASRLILIVALAIAAGYGISYLSRQVPPTNDTIPSLTNPPPGGQDVTDTQSLLLANAAEVAVAANDPDSALVLALSANQTPHPALPIWRALIKAAYTPGTRRIIVNDVGVIKVAITADGKMLSTIAYGSKKISLWDAATGKLIRQIGPEISHDDNWLDFVAFSPDGKTVAASGGLDTAIYLYNVQTGQEVRRLQDHEAPVKALAFSHDGKNMLSGASDITVGGQNKTPLVELRDHTLRLWDVASGTVMRRFDGQSDSTTFLSFSSDDTLCYSTTRDGSIYEWETATGQLLNSFVNSGQNAFAGAVSPDGKFALMGGSAADLSKEGTLMLWSLPTNTAKTLDKHTQQVSAVAFSPDSRIAASGSYDKTVALWDSGTGQELHTYVGVAGQVFDIEFSPDGLSLFTVEGRHDGIRGNVTLLAIDSSAETSKTSFDSAISSLAVSPDGASLLIGLKSGELIFQDRQTGQIRSKIQVSHSPITSVAFSLDGTMMLSSSEYPGGAMQLWNAATGQSVHVFTDDGSLPSFKRSVFTPDGKTILATALGGKVYMWDVATAQNIGELSHPGDEVEDIAVSPDGRLALAGIQHAQLDLWDTASHKLVRTFADSLGGNLASVAFSPDQKFVYAGLDDGNIVIFDIRTAQKVRQLRGHQGAVSRMAFSTDGQYLVSASTGVANNLILWDATSGEQLYVYSGHTGGVNGVVVSRDNLTAFSISDDRSLRTWALPGDPDHLKQWIAQNRYVRDLTCNERKQFNINPLCTR